VPPEPARETLRITGRWLVGQNGGYLVIGKDEWTHSTKGVATLKFIGTQELLVQYPQQTGVKCSYRVTLLDRGTTLFLEASNALQPEEYCPAGRLTSGQ
jgi:hypothetical protein